MKSIWDKERKTSRQETIKYLGELSAVTRNDLPEEYKDDVKINSFLLENTPKDSVQQEEMVTEIRNKLFMALSDGNLKNARKIYASFTTDKSLDKFYERIMTPVMTEIGELWAKGELSIATEHVASNTAHSLVKVISDDSRKFKKTKGIIVLTTPVGEDHSLGCNMLDSFLTSKGFTIFNLSPSTPAESLIEFIKASKPNALFVSITLEENIKTGQRMVKKIHNKFNKLQIFIGGQAFSQKTNLKFEGELIANAQMLEQIPRIIKRNN